MSMPASSDYIIHPIMMILIFLVLTILPQGRMIKKAFGKLKLEHVVIAKGQFQQDSAKPNTLEVSEFCYRFLI